MQVAETWGQRMDPEFYQSVDKRERDRQEAINEIIYGEEQYLKDLELLRQVSIDIMMIWACIHKATCCIGNH